MKTKTWLLPAFMLVALVQLYVPAQMIWSREKILDTGTTFKFRTAPLDPNDPFRGKYVALQFRNNSIPLTDERTWDMGDEIYVQVQPDNQGFARIKAIFKTKPETKFSYIKATVDYVTNEHGKRELFIRYPFDRFYMEETVAPEAEKVYLESVQDTSRITYALVSIREGEAVLKDVKIDSLSLAQIVKASRKNEIKQP